MEEITRILNYLENPAQFHWNWKDADAAIVRKLAAELAALREEVEHFKNLFNAEARACILKDNAIVALRATFPPDAAELLWRLANYAGAIDCEECPTRCLDIPGLPCLYNAAAARTWAARLGEVLK